MNNDKLNIPEDSELPEELLLHSMLLFADEEQTEPESKEDANADPVLETVSGPPDASERLQLDQQSALTYYQCIKREISEYLIKRQNKSDNFRTALRSKKPETHRVPPLEAVNKPAVHPPDRTFINTVEPSVKQSRQPADKLHTPLASIPFHTCGCKSLPIALERKNQRSKPESASCRKPEAQSQAFMSPLQTRSSEQRFSPKKQALAKGCSKPLTDYMMRKPEIETVPFKATKTGTPERHTLDFAPQKQRQQAFAYIKCCKGDARLQLDNSDTDLFAMDLTGQQKNRMKLEKMEI